MVEYRDESELGDGDEAVEYGEKGLCDFLHRGRVVALKTDWSSEKDVGDFKKEWWRLSLRFSLHLIFREKARGPHSVDLSLKLQEIFCKLDKIPASLCSSCWSSIMMI